MKQMIWTASYEVNTLVLTPQKRLGLVGLLQILQDMAWRHAQHLGHGYDDMIAAGTLWVLTRFTLRLTGPWPAWGESVTVNTWARPPAAAVVLRDYEVLVGGEKIAEATASWLTLDAQTRRPLKTSLNDEALQAGRREGALSLEPAKLRWQNGLSEVGAAVVRNSDLDLNGHVNNTHYAQWILDTLPPSAFECFRLSSYEVNFLAESLLGDTVILETSPLADDTALVIQGRRASDDKPVFVARLTAAVCPA
ncbi:acyl-[acyl-carrier-protein] thioesterase [Pararhodospirillum photometricum]|nr:acyl-ACP thioesterase domain-containing protein [Pararhodospirillum photometricum]